MMRGKRRKLLSLSLEVGKRFFGPFLSPLLYAFINVRIPLYTDGHVRIRVECRPGACEPFV